MTNVLPTFWTLDEALGLIRALQPQTRRYGYHLCLGGGVMNNGRSDKDLDLYFLSLDNGSVVPEASKVVEWLDGLWGEGEDIWQEYEGQPHQRENSKYEVKRKYDYNGLRIDVFVI